MMKQVLLIALLLLTSSFLPPRFAAASGPDPKSNINCPDKCNERCAKSGRPKLCIKYCNICCDKCKCVPSGTSGNKDQCPCYRDMKNKKGTGKCP